MARFQGILDETYTIQAPPEAVRAHFLDRDQIIACFGDLDEFEKVGDDTIRFVMEEQNHGVFTFQGRYACAYHPDGEHGARWQTVQDGPAGTNVWVTGRLTVEPGEAPGTTRMRYFTDMALDVEVNAMLEPVLKPVVGAAIPAQVRDYVKRMIRAVEAQQD